MHRSRPLKILQTGSSGVFGRFSLVLIDGGVLVNFLGGGLNDDFSLLEKTNRWLGWLGDQPVDVIRNQVIELLSEQVPGCVVESVKVVRDPLFLTAGRRVGPGGKSAIVTKAALSVKFDIFVLDPPCGVRERVVAALSWVAVGLDRAEDRNDRIWFDVGKDSEKANSLLRSRLLGLEERS